LTGLCRSLFFYEDSIMYQRKILAPSIALMLGAPLCAAAADDAELKQIRQEMQQTKEQYEARIQALEKRVEQAESKSTQAQATAEKASSNAPSSAHSSSANAFNPAISVVLVGTLAEFENDPEDYTLPGFALGGESGPGEEGFSLGESELNIEANIDDKLLGSLTFALASEGGETEVELEEAYIQTLALPAGFTAKAGRFFSRIGYLNEFHTHTDDFVDRPLAYRALLANQYGDDGVQVRWVAPTDLFVELGAEWFRGERFPGGGADNEGTGTYSVFAHAGGDVGVSHSWRAGLSYLRAKAEGRETEEGASVFTGDSNVTIADLVWKWAPNGDASRTNFKFQSEYIYRDEDGVFNDLSYSGEQDGWYTQAIYQFMPRWRAGFRYDRLGADNDGDAVAGTVLDDLGHTPERFTALLEYDNSEFSRLRLQYNRDESQPDSDNQLFLNYVVSLGAHGAHPF
jgi:hypothetical protein